MSLSISPFRFAFLSLLLLSTILCAGATDTGGIVPPTSAPKAAKSSAAANAQPPATGVVPTSTAMTKASAGALVAPLAGNPPSAPLVSTPQSPQAAASIAPSPAIGVSASSVELPQIVVSAATRETQPIDTTATTTTVITNQQLEAAHYLDVSAALQSVPGINVVTSGAPGAQTSVFIHGLDSRNTLVTIDGRRQPAGFSGADDNLQNLSLDNVNQLEIVRSPVTAINGGGAMGGVINIVTLSGRGLSTPVSSFSEEAGSFDTFRENLQSRGAAGAFDYAVSGSRQDSIYPALSPGNSLFGSPGFPGQADQFRNSTYRGNFGYQLNPDIYLDLHTAYGNAYTSSPGEFVFPDPTANLTTEAWTLSPEVVARVTDFYSTKLYYTHDQQRQSSQDPFNFVLDGGGQGFLSRSQINTDSVDWQNDFQVTRDWSLIAGLQGDHHRFYDYDSGIDALVANGNNDNLGGYLSSQWQPVANLNILSSARYDNYSEYKGAFSWRQGIAYTVAASGTQLHASVGRAYTPPSLQDLYISFPAFGEFANPNLQPETVLGWEAGVVQPLFANRLTPSLTYFHNDEQHSIQTVADPAAGPFGTILENVNHVTTDGVEIGLGLKPIEQTSLQANYTYTDAVNDDTYLRLLRRPRNAVEVNGTWNPIPPLTLTLGGSWVIGRQDLNPLTGDQVVAPDYFTLRASATYRINRFLSVWVRGENLTDRNYQPALGFYANSIAGYGGIKVTF